MPGPSVVLDGLRATGARGTHGSRREQRITRLVNKVFEMREQGHSKREIRDALHTSDGAIDRILQDPENVRRRLTQYNEQLRATTPKALRVVHEVLDSTSPQQFGQRAEMARWVLESVKVVGKESPVNVFIRGGDTNINLTNDTLEAARAVAAAMRATVEAKALPQGEVIDAKVLDGEPAGDSGGDEVGVVDTQEPGSGSGNSNGL